MSEPFEIDTLTLKERLDGDNPPVVLDVREPWEIDIASIEGAVTIPLGEFIRAGSANCRATGRWP